MSCATSRLLVAQKWRRAVCAATTGALREKSSSEPPRYYPFPSRAPVAQWWSKDPDGRGGGRKSEVAPPLYPRAFSPRDFFRGPAELLGLTWEVCRTVWQTTPGLGSADGGLNCARKNENSGASG